MESQNDFSDIGGIAVSKSGDQLSSGINQTNDFSDLGGRLIGGRLINGENLQQLPNKQAEKQENIGDTLVRRGALDTISGLAQMGRGLVNSPYSLGITKQPVIDPSFDYSKALGIKNKNIADDIVQGAVKYAPFGMAGRVAGLTSKAIPLMSLRGLAGEAGVGAAYGALQSENPLSGTIESSAIAAGLPIVGVGGLAALKGLGILGKGVLSAAGKALPNLSKENLVNDIHDFLGGGGSSSDSRKNLAEEIKTAYEVDKKPIQEAYTKLFLDNPGRMFSPNDKSEASEYLGQANKFLNVYSPGAKQLHEDFVNEPTFKNAHELMSQLKSDIRDLSEKSSREGLDAAENSKVIKFNKANSFLDSDVNSYLKSKGKEQVYDLYKELNKDYAKKIVKPYWEDNNLRQIAEGEIENPSKNTIYSIFKNLQPGSGINSLVDRVGAGSLSKKIIHSELASKNSRELLRRFDKINDSSSLDDYINNLPGLADKMRTLKDVHDLHEFKLTKYPTTIINQLAKLDTLNRVAPNSSNALGSLADLYRAGAGTAAANFINQQN